MNGNFFLAKKLQLFIFVKQNLFNQTFLMRTSLLILLLLAFNAGAQPRLERHYSHKLYTTYDGLVQSQVTYLFQDSKGYLWIGTKVGLSRFDGENFINFIDKSNGGRQFISQMIEYEDGLLIASRRKIWKFTYDEENPENWQFTDLEGFGDHVFTVMQKMLFYPPDSCLYLTNTCKEHDHNTYYHLKYNPRTESAERLPIGTQSVLLTRRTGQGVQFISNDSVFDYRAGTMSARPLPCRADWLTDKTPDSTLLLYIKNERHFVRLDQSFALTDTVYRGTNLWCDIQHNFVPDFDNNYYYRDSLNIVYSTAHKKFQSSTNPIYLFFDRENNFWMGSENGVYNLYRAGFEQLRFNMGKSVDNVWSMICTPDSTMWFGGYGIGMWSLGKNNKLEAYDHFSENPHYYMGGIVDQEGRGYLPNSKGFITIDNKKLSEQILGEWAPMAMTDDTLNNRLLLGTSGGFCVLEKGTWKVLQYFKLPRSVVSTCFNKRGELLLGTFASQYLFANDTLQPYRPEGGLGVISMAKDFKGNIWKGTPVGLYLDNGENEIPQFGEKISGMIHSVYIKDHWLLVATVNRLYMANLDSFYTASEPMLYEFEPGNGYFAMDGGQNGFCTDYAGYVWYTVSDKVLRFSPDELAQNYKRVTPSPHFVSFYFSDDQMHWERVNLATQNNIVLRSFQNSVQFSFVAISLTYADKMLYRFRVNGLGDEWSEPTKIKRYTFAKLKPGSYRVEVQSSCHAGQWSPSVFSPPFTIRKAWWHYWSIRLILLVFFVAFIVFTTRFLVKRRQTIIMQKLKEQSRLNELRLQTVRSKHIPHFSGNALSNIESFIFSSDLRKANKYLSKYSKLMNITLRDADKASRSVQEELEYVSLYLELEKMRFEDDIDFRFELDPSVDQTREVPNMLLQTWVENAIKHGLRHKQGLGNIVVSVQNGTNNELLLSVEDNGIGREMAKQMGTAGTGQGLKILEEQIAIYNHFNLEKINLACIDLTNSEGKAGGTRFEMCIPAGYNFNATIN
jgi:two-component sensor histidine kinase